MLWTKFCDSETHVNAGSWLFSNNPPTQYYCVVLKHFDDFLCHKSRSSFKDADIRLFSEVVKRSD